MTGPVGGAPMMRFMARPGRRRQVQRPVHIGVGDRTGTPTRPARQAPDQKKKPVTVHDNVPAGPDGASTRRAYNPVESDAARSKADALQARFADWLWQDPVRADRLVDDYNRRFNSTVLRDYGTAGQALTLPGLAKNFTPPRPHQLAVVARIIGEPSVGLFHEVGAGKTAEMVMGCMELRRLGLVTEARTPNEPARTSPSNPDTPPYRRARTKPRQDTPPRPQATTSPSTNRFMDT